MANPQIENGHIDIANEIVEAFCKGFPGFGEGQLLWAILRKTYGWHKKEDTISISQLQEMTELSRRMVIYGIQNLEAKRMIIVERKRGRGIKNEINLISFQKNYDKWIVQEKSTRYKNSIEKRKLAYQKSKTGVVQENIGSARNGNLVVQETVKDSRFLAPTKTTITKENTKEIYMRFETFYKAYPKKKSKPQALKAWVKIRPDETLLNIMLTAIERQKQTFDWQKEDGQFIPFPATWLNQRRWEDEDGSTGSDMDPVETIRKAREADERKRAMAIAGEN